MFLYKFDCNDLRCNRQTTNSTKGEGQARGRATDEVDGKASDQVNLEQESADEAGARGGQLEVLDGEWEVIVIWVIDEEAVVDALLQAFGLVASRHQRTGLSSGASLALFNAGVLVEFVAVRLDFVDDDAPLSIDVDSAQRLHVRGGAWTQVCLVSQGSERVNRVGRVDSDVLVEGQHGLVVGVEGVDDI